MSAKRIGGFIKIMSSQNGYSMVEILTVVFILAILASIGFPKYMSMQSEAIEKTCQANMKSIEAAFRLKYTKALLSDASTDFTTVMLVATDFSSGALPSCPEDGSSYTVTPNANGTLAISCPNGHILP